MIRGEDGGNISSGDEEVDHETLKKMKKKMLFKDSCKKDDPLLENNDDSACCKMCIYVFSVMFLISILPLY